MMSRRCLSVILILGVSVAGWLPVVGCARTSDVSGGPTNPADKVLVEKSARRLTLFYAGKPVRVYRVALGKHPVGPKERQDDGRTPEGSYVIDSRNSHSGFHRALHISYPNDADRARAAALGLPPGGDIMIHGIKNGLGWLGRLHRLADWTQGCVAVTDEEIEEIWSLVKNGTVVEIVP